LPPAAVLARLVQGDVVRHDQRRRRADLQARTHLDAVALELGDLLLQGRRVQHHAVADQAQRVGAQDAGRDQVQHGLLAADDQGVAGVVAALEAHDRADFLGQQVDDLALALVAPLRAQHHHRLTHDRDSKSELRPGGDGRRAPSRGPDVQKAGGRPGFAKLSSE